MTVLLEAHEVIHTYSTTWYEPVTRMPSRLNEAISCAYLLMRGIDEIEDHPTLPADTKAQLLRGVSAVWQERCRPAELNALLAPHHDVLPEVTLRLDEWSRLAPEEIAPRVQETFATMAERMATWAQADFAIRTEADLDRYTYAVAGTLVLLLSDLWTWYDGTAVDRTLGVAYGRALQAVNILIDRDTDTARGVDFWPDNWGTTEMSTYARTELTRADQYLDSLRPGPARTFCDQPLRNAHKAWATVPWPPHQGSAA
ncbi:squalene/phytoene synthase family protein [Streptomyces syringium]|uniref:squalene/phytoene synthase family protein n=1 Tax=Streptomyces syringium TaxID=76729 RepID=UPI00345435EC